MIKRVDNAVFLSAKDFIAGNGKLDGGYRTFGLKEDGVGFAENQFNKANLADVRAKILQLRDGHHQREDHGPGREHRHGGLGKGPDVRRDRFEAGALLLPLFFPSDPGGVAWPTPFWS